MDALIEVITLPVADPDRSIEFYCDRIGFVLDVDYAPSPLFRVVQLTPRGGDMTDIRHKESDGGSGARTSAVWIRSMKPSRTAPEESKRRNQ